MILRTSRSSRALFAVFQDVYTNKKDNLSYLNTYKHGWKYDDAKANKLLKDVHWQWCMALRSAESDSPGSGLGDSSLGLKEAKPALTDCFLATNWEAIIGSVLKTVFTVNHNVHWIRWDPLTHNRPKITNILQGLYLVRVLMVLMMMSMRNQINLSKLFILGSTKTTIVLWKTYSLVFYLWRDNKSCSTTSSSKDEMKKEQGKVLKYVIMKGVLSRKTEWHDM